jgi:hypothetical protein
VGNVATEVGATGPLIERREPLDPHEVWTRQEAVPEDDFTRFHQEVQYTFIEPWRLVKPYQLISVRHEKMMDCTYFIAVRNRVSRRFVATLYPYGFSTAGTLKSAISKVARASFAFVSAGTI